MQILSDLLCCLGRIRTLTGGTRIRRATITPQGNQNFQYVLLKRVVPFCDCKGNAFFCALQVFVFLFLKILSPKFPIKGATALLLIFEEVVDVGDDAHILY